MEMRRVLVTGSSRGLGREMARLLARDGFAVTIHCREDEEGARRTCSEISTGQFTAHYLKFDIKDREKSRALIEKDIADFGSYYGVITNAGIFRDNAFPMMTANEWDDVIHTNLDGFYNVVQPCVMPMVQARRGGRIIAISSVSGIVGNRGQVNYSAAKAGLIGATKALALELAKREITVNCVAPGLIDTGVVNSEVFEHVKEMIPLRRMGRSEEVAGLVAFLMSDLAGYITRQVISVNGGLV